MPPGRDSLAERAMNGCEGFEGDKTLRISSSG